MDIVLGVSMAPTSVRMLVVGGEDADGAALEDTTFGIETDDDTVTLSAADQVVSAILGTREGAGDAGHELTSTGITWTDPVDAAALRDALATRKIENVMLVSSFMAAAALAQTIGEAHTALLFLEPGTATLAVVDPTDGSITDVRKELVSGEHSVAELADMVAGLDELETRPQSVFIVGAGVDVATIKEQLEAVTTLPVTAAEEPETALARGAALASANAPLFASSTAALAYAQDPGTGAIDPYAVSPGYLAALEVPLDGAVGDEDLAYSAVPDEDDAQTLLRQEDEIHTVSQEASSAEHLEGEHQRGRLVLVGSILAVLFVAAALSLEVALALGIRPSVALLPRPLQNLIIQNPAPVAEPIQQSAPAPHVNQLVSPAAPAVPVRAAAPAAPAPPPIEAAPPPPAALPAPIPAPELAPVPIPVRVPIPVHIPVRAPSPPPAQLPVQAPEPVHAAPPPQTPPLPGIPLLPGLPGLGIPGVQPPVPVGPPGGFGGGPGGPPAGNPGGPPFGGGPGGPPAGNPGGPPFGNPGGFGGPPGGNPGGPGGPPGGFGGGPGGPPGDNPGGFGGPPGGNPGGFGGLPGGNPGGFGGPPGGNQGGFGGPPGGGFGGPGGFGGGPGGFGGPPGGFGGGGHGGFGGGGFGGGGFGGGHGGGFGGGGHSGGFGGGGFGGGHGGGGHH